jgi:hypothetical protein
LAPEVAGGRVDVRPVASLLPHEDTITPQADKLAAAMQRQGVQRDPLIADRETGTVLDGMHRLSAFKKMGAEYAVCYLVDYSSKSVTLERWVRVLSVSKTSLVPHVLENLGIDRKVTLSEVFDLVESRRSTLAIVGSSGSYVPSASIPDLSAAFELVRKIDGLAGALGWNETFVSDDEVDVELQDERKLLVLLPRLSKQDVLTAARSGRLFPCKTTLHLIDPRPVAIGFPLGELMKRAPPRPVLEALLKEDKSSLLPANSVYEGRRYKERLLVLRGQ